jgi:hypothetical protein
MRVVRMEIPMNFTMEFFEECIGQKKLEQLKFNPSCQPE